MTHDDIKKYIIDFNIRFPYDRWWRKKYTIAFNSPLHRESNFIDQLIEYEEDQLFQELENQEKYTPNTGDWIKQKEINSESLEDMIKNCREEFNLDSEDE
jgi:hypothetical protein